MKYLIGLGVTLMAVWLLWSGHYSPLIISFGVASCALVLAITHRMNVVDNEAVPVEITGRLLIYLPWLAWQVILSNLAVARIILSPSLPIAPRLIRTPAGQKGEVGRVIFANSITLTPGTVSLIVNDNEILVHALTQEAEDDLQSGKMNEQVIRVEGNA